MHSSSLSKQAERNQSSVNTSFLHASGTAQTPSVCHLQAQKYHTVNKRVWGWRAWEDRWERGSEQRWEVSKKDRPSKRKQEPGWQTRSTLHFSQGEWGCDVTWVRGLCTVPLASIFSCLIPVPKIHLTLWLLKFRTVLTALQLPALICDGYLCVEHNEIMWLKGH